MINRALPYGYRDDIRAQLLRATLVSTDDSGVQQLNALTGLANHSIGEGVRSQHFGLTSNPPKNAEGLVLVIGGGFDRAHVLGLEHPQYRPKNTPVGGTILYDAYGSMVSLVQQSLRVVHAQKITIQAPTIELVGNVSLGGTAGSGVPVAKQGTIDTAGNADVSNLSTKVTVV